MASDKPQNWILIGNAEDLKRDLASNGGLKEIIFGEKKVALSFFENKFGAIGSRCNHMGGPLARGKIEGGYVECPWHYWKFHHQSGEAMNTVGEPIAKSGGSIPSYNLKVENGDLYLDLASETKRISATYNQGLPISHLFREPKREPGRIRVVGISTTSMDKNHPRYSTSIHLLKSSLLRAENELDVETKFLALHEMNIRPCEGFYSKSERACSWPCSITKIDFNDEMAKIYDALVFWADVVVVATPIRWGSASSLYYKMVERLNSIQNQITLKNKVLIQQKVASFIITGGQDNIQMISGQMLSFFGELGFVSPPFPFVGHSLGWTAEEMERNTDFVQRNEKLHEQAFELLQRSVDLSKTLLAGNN
ncbi:MAG: hypothetical protein A4S09_04750 [Proteobacteria bacterium SG_bin7]|nr:MAG: hypothetical protein A4S09_04750 [Proteobacteria bacterium SG_bin7]